VAAKIERRENRKAALKNLQTLRPEFVPTLRYLKANNLKRFSAAAPWRNIILREMVQSFLIEIDDPSYQPNMSDTYYSVPNYVWEWMARVEPDMERRPDAGRYSKPASATLGPGLGLGLGTVYPLPLCLKLGM
jgi:hypothetical protein